MRTRSVLGLLFLLVLVACQEPLEGFGEFSSEWVSGPSTTVDQGAVTAGPEEQPDPLRRATAVEWDNDSLGAPSTADRSEVLVRVLDRAREGVAFVQASRFEIAAVLPELLFPAEVPGEVEHITSQLVFLPQAGILNEEGLAAFGMWEVRPYSVSRTVGQDAALMVAGAEAVPVPGQDLAACEGYNPGEASCEAVTLRGRPAWSVDGPKRRVLVWAEGPFRYELICRDQVEAVRCRAMADSMVPLASLIERGEEDVAEEAAG